MLYTTSVWYKQGACMWCMLSPSDFIPLSPVLPVQSLVSKLY